MFIARATAFFLLLSILLPCGLQAAETNVNKIAAVVNGEMITLHELRLFTSAELARRRISPNDARADQVQAEILDSMINDILMRQEAKRYKISISDADVTAEYNRMQTRSGLPKDKFEADLRKQGLTPELVRLRLGNNMLRQRFSHFMISRKVFVTPEQVRAYYDSHKSDMAKPKTVNFSIMMLPSSLNIQQIHAQLKSGAVSFEETARAHSRDAAAAEGGRVTDVIWDKLPNDMKKILNTLTPGGLTPPLRTRDGVVIIRLDNFSEARNLTFEEAKPRIEEILLTPLLEERFNELVTQLRGKAVIDIRI